VKFEEAPAMLLFLGQARGGGKKNPNFFDLGNLGGGKSRVRKKCKALHSGKNETNGPQRTEKAEARV